MVVGGDRRMLPIGETTDAHHQIEMACETCHAAPAFAGAAAAVKAMNKTCRNCHEHALWQAELAGEAPPGAGVSCATCHMAKVGRRGKIVTNHNQNDVLRPNEKMIRPVCLDCHGLGFAIDALADADLVARNFRAKPSVHVESIEWALRRASDPGRAGNE